MINFSRNIVGLIDLHCHIVPFVDDGAEDYEEAQELIRKEYSQGVRLLVMTVHLRLGMFDTSISKVEKHFENIKNWLSGTSMRDMDILLSREYYCDKRFELLLDGYTNEIDEVVFEEKKYFPKEELKFFGKNKCILLEFSSNKIQNSEFEIFIRKASQAGFTPIIAHAERYPAVQDSPSIVYKMKEQGALVQVNCESLLSKAGTIECLTAQNLVKYKLADIVSSDCHNLRERQPEIRKCYFFLKRKYGISTADKLMRDTAVSFIYGGEAGNCKELFINVKN
jgi:protein-tyrosine phosphatase